MLIKSLSLNVIWMERLQKYNVILRLNTAGAYRQAMANRSQDRPRKTANQIVKVSDRGAEKSTKTTLLLHICAFMLFTPVYDSSNM